MSNISYVGPGSSCSYLGSQTPAIWKATNSTDAACSVPNCLDNSAALQQCCTGGTVASFNNTVRPNAGTTPSTIEAQWLYCALPGVNASAFQQDRDGVYHPDDPYQRYQDCLVRAGAQRLVCNDPGRYRVPGGESVCLLGANTGITTPQGVGANASSHPEAVCTVNTDSDAAGTLAACCVNGNGTLRAEQFGCQASCSGDGTLQACVQNGRMESGFLSLCRNYTSDAGSAGAGASGGNVGRERLTLVGVLMLSVLFAVL